jgi:hypothetical protein
VVLGIFAIDFYGAILSEKRSAVNGTTARKIRILFPVKCKSNFQSGGRELEVSLTGKSRWK